MRDVVRQLFGGQAGRFFSLCRSRLPVSCPVECVVCCVAGGAGAEMQEETWTSCQRLSSSLSCLSFSLLELTMMERGQQGLISQN